MITRIGSWVIPNPRSLLIANDPKTQDIGSSGTGTIASSLPFGL